MRLKELLEEYLDEESEFLHSDIIPQKYLDKLEREINKIVGKAKGGTSQCEVFFELGKFIGCVDKKRK